MDTVYEPSVIKDNPLPDSMPQTQSAASALDNSTMGVSQPNTIADVTVPRKMVAQETIGETLNTKARKITADYSFTESGSLEIGAYTPGVTGDVRISPAGITARDKAGNTTFDLDGDSGDATFSGQVRGASFLNDFFSVDTQGNVIAQSISIVTQNVINSGNNIGTDITTEQDLANTSINLKLARRTVVLCLIDVAGYIYLNSGGTPYLGRGVTRLYVDSSDVSRCFISGGVSATGDGLGHTLSFGVALGSASMSYMATLNAGTHTLKLTAACDVDTGSPKFVVYSYKLKVVTLGNG